MKLFSYSTILLAILLFITNSGLSGQIVDKTEEKAKKKTNQRIDKKIDNGIDSGLDAIEGLFKRKNKDKKQEDSAESSDQESQEAMSKLFGGDVKVRDSYQFDHTIDMLTQIYNKKGELEDEVPMQMLISESEPVFGMKMNSEGTEVTMVYDLEELQMITMTNSDQAQNFGMVMKLDPESAEEIQKDEPSEASFEKTGRTETISGYRCEEYEVKDSDADEDYENFVWMTDESGLNWMEAFAEIMKNQETMDAKMAEEYPEGMMIRTVNKSKKSEEMTISTVQNVMKNSNVEISTKGYQFMSMGGGQR